jgi:hypothetical protein
MCRSTLSGGSMNFTFSIGPLVSLIAGVLILIIPRLLNYIIALYLIIIGILGLTGMRGAMSAEADNTPPAAVQSVAPDTPSKPIGI